MHTLLQVACKYTTALIFYLNADYGCLEVLVLYFPQKFLLTKLVNPKNVAHSSYQFASILIESQGYVFARCRVDKLKYSTVLNEAIGLDKADRARSGRELHIKARTQDQEGVVAMLTTESCANEMREYNLIILKFFKIKGFKLVRIDYSNAGGKLV